MDTAVLLVHEWSVVWLGHSPTEGQRVRRVLIKPLRTCGTGFCVNVILPLLGSTPWSAHAVSCGRGLLSCLRNSCLRVAVPFPVPSSRVPVPSGVSLWSVAARPRGVQGVTGLDLQPLLEGHLSLVWEVTPPVGACATGPGKAAGGGGADGGVWRGAGSEIRATEL